MTSPGPIAATATWQAVMDTAGHRCQCVANMCGGRHIDSDGRCDSHNHSGGPGLARARFYVAPLDPSMPTIETAKLPAAELLAWCEDCYGSALRQGRRARKAAAIEAPEPDSLF